MHAFHCCCASVPSSPLTHTTHTLSLSLSISPPPLFHNYQFNSWDREVYLSYRGVDKANDTVSFNYFLANYNAQDAVDTDDGSAYYNTHNNVLVYSGNGMKSDFGGHDSFSYLNVYAFLDSGFGLVWQEPGHYDYFHSNHVVLNADGDYGGAANYCTKPTLVLYNNTVFSPTGKVTECGMPLEKWVALGHDLNSTAHPWPEDAELLAVMAATLGGIYNS